MNQKYIRCHRVQNISEKIVWEKVVNKFTISIDLVISIKALALSEALFFKVKRRP